VPTGGGKTLLATQILGLVYQTILKKRNGCGLVLWVGEIKRVGSLMPTTYVSTPALGN
jgi:hypothetical protein